MTHNLEWMQRFVDTYGLKLAPHGKTTMAPALFRRQIAHGAWGITVATAQQARVAAAHGVRRILIANQVVGRANVAMLAALLREPGLELFVLVDSPETVGALAGGMDGVPVDVLLELAPDETQGGYRAGVRTPEAQRETLDAIARSSGRVRLAGIELYEGVLSDEGEIRTFLRRAVAATTEIARADGFARQRPILSGAGSAWYDVVAEEFAALAEKVDVVLRPGCYLSHDAGLYRDAQARILARNPIAAAMRAALQPALQIWACVQSIPSTTRAVIALGKRDAAFDAGLPHPALVHRPARDPRPAAAPAHWSVSGMMDQHAFLDIGAGDDIQVGDMIAFDISHPCLTFDRWRHLLVVDDDYRCIEVVTTCF